MIFVKESGKDFGPFKEDRLFRIEGSSLQLNAGDSVKTVEFIYLTEKETYWVVEAKTSCPNFANIGDSEERKVKYQAYYDDISQKFIDSVNMFGAAVLGLHGNIAEVGPTIKSRPSFAETKMLWILVITEAQINWLQQPKAELEDRLRHYRKLWQADILVLNTELAQKYKLIQQ